MNNCEKTTFWNFVNEHSITIPIIQRDYAQGREGKEELRKRFLKELKNAIADKSSLHLDFAYGSFNKDVFYPLDGQQRLTTLWLVHWYIAYKAGKLEEVREILQRFSYATHVPARDFCHKLCELSPMPEGVASIEKHIKNQNWFYSAWNQDPTVASILRMLSGTDRQDGIEETVCFDDYTDKWTFLTGEDCQIDFRVLNISEIGQTDDLYIKMNARGKALTSFENFKAELLEYFHKKASEDGKLHDCLTDGFVQKLDNAWTDILWKLRSKDASGIPEYQNHIDEIFFAFFNRFFFKEQALKASSEGWNKLPLYGKNGDDTSLAFANLTNYFVSNDGISLETFQNIELVLDRWPALQIALGNGVNPPLGPSWNPNDFLFLPEYTRDKDAKLSLISDESGNEILKISAITVKQRAIFFAICQWLIKNDSLNGYSAEQIQHFKDWLRVVWNIVENSNADGNLPGILKLIDELTPHCDDILGFLVGQEEIESDFAKEQLLEEREKARQILCGQNVPEGFATWKEAIITAEKYAFFHGCIHFLYRNETGKANWNQFAVKWNHAQKYFVQNGVVNDIDIRVALCRACIKCAPDLWERHLFSPSSSDWLTFLSDAAWQETSHDLLYTEDLDSLTLKTNSDWMTKIKEWMLTLPIKWICENACFIRLHNYNGNQTLYNSYNAGNIAFVYSPKRMRILKNADIIPNKNGVGSLFGWDIKFLYNQEEVTWTWNDKITCNGDTICNAVDFETWDELCTKIDNWQSSI